MDITVPSGKRVCVLVGHRAEVGSAKQDLHLREVSFSLYFKKNYERTKASNTS